MISKSKLLVLSLVMLMVLGLMSGLASAEEECPAAPAIAAELLREAGIEQLGPFVSQVARETRGRNATFLGDYEKCDPGYRDAVRDFLTSIGVVFSPARYSGMSLWLDGNSFIGEEEGAKVEAWADVSGNNNDAYQINTNKQPTIAYPFKNDADEADLSLPVVSFNDLYDQSFNFSSPVLPVNEDFTFSVLLNVPAGVVNDHDVILSQYPSSGISAGDMIFYSRSTFGTAEHQIRFWIRDAGEILVGSDIRGEGWVHVCLTRKGDTWTLFENGEVVDQKEISVYIVQDETALSAVARFDSRHFNGDIAEVLAYDRALSSNEMVAIENYLKTKHGF